MYFLIKKYGVFDLKIYNKKNKKSIFFGMIYTCKLSFQKAKDSNISFIATSQLLNIILSCLECLILEVD
jgi:hypothetical protein